MYQSKPPKIADATPVALDLADDETLRPLSWEDLRMRLAKVHGSRRASSETGAGDDRGNEASFDALHARHIAELHDCKDPVNPDDLAKFKGTGCTSGGTEKLPKAGTRGLE